MWEGSAARLRATAPASPRRVGVLIRRSNPFRAGRDELSTGQGSALRRQASSRLGLGQPGPAPKARLGLSLLRLEAQISSAPSAAARVAADAAAALGASPGPASAQRAVQLLNTRLLGLARDLPGREAAFRASLPVLEAALAQVSQMKPPERLAFVGAVDRLLLVVSRAHQRPICQALGPSLTASCTELEALARRRRTPFLTELSQYVATRRGWAPR